MSHGLLALPHQPLVRQNQREHDPCEGDARGVQEKDEGGAHGVRSGSSCLQTQDFPGHIGAKLFASDGVDPLLCCDRTHRALDHRAVLSGHTVANPGLHRLVAPPGHIEGNGRADRATEDVDRLLGRDLAGSGSLHAPESMLVSLVLLESLAFASLTSHEKLAPMSIHEAIKARRLALDWSHERLAEEVSKREGLTKKLSWQTVQQWENGKSAPKRQRLEHVAAALGCRVEDLIGLVTMNFDEAAERALAPPPTPPRDFHDRHEVSDSDWGLLQDVHLVLSDHEVEELRMRAERTRRIAHAQIESMAAAASPQSSGRVVHDENSAPAPAGRKHTK